MSLTTQSSSTDTSTTSEPDSAVAAPSGPDLLSERGVIAATSLGHFLCHLAETIYPAVMVAVMAEFTSLDRKTAASLATLGYVLLGVGALPVGIWADTWGPTRVFRFYFLAMAVSCLLVALTPTVWLLFVTLTLLGLAASIYHPVGLAMISLGVRAKGRAMGINGVAGSFGIAMGPALGIMLRAPGVWRWAYVIVGLVAFGALLYFHWLLRRSRVTSYSDASMPPTIVAPPVSAPLVHEENTQQYWRRLVPLLLLYAAMLCAGFNYRVLITALPTYVSGEHAAGLELLFGSFQVFLILLVGGVGQYFGGWLADRYGARAVYPMLIATVIPMGLLVAFLEGTDLVMFVGCLLAVSMFGQQPVENSVIADYTRRSRRGLSYASKFTLTFGLGALGNEIAGSIWQHYGSFAPAFVFIAASASVMAVLAVLAIYLKKDTLPTARTENQEC